MRNHNVFLAKFLIYLPMDFLYLRVVCQRVFWNMRHLHITRFYDLVWEFSIEWLHILVDLKGWHLVIFVQIHIIMVIKSLKLFLCIRALLKHFENLFRNWLLAVDILSLAFQSQPYRVHRVFIWEIEKFLASNFQNALNQENWIFEFVQLLYHFGKDIDMSFQFWTEKTSKVRN